MSGATTDGKRFYFRLVFSLIDKEADERPTGRRVGLVSQNMDHDDHFGIPRTRSVGPIFRGRSRPLVWSDEGPDCYQFSIPVMGCVEKFCAKTIVLIRVQVENVVRSCCLIFEGGLILVVCWSRSGEGGRWNVLPLCAVTVPSEESIMVLN